MKRLLVVDDNIDILELIQSHFTGLGYEVMIASNGEEAYKNIDEFPPNVILLDAFIQGENGIFICNELKSKPETKDIPIVMFSAHSNGDEVLRMCPAEAFVAKPFNIFHLTEVIAEQLNNYRV